MDSTSGKGSCSICSKQIEQNFAQQQKDSSRKVKHCKDCFTRLSTFKNVISEKVDADGPLKFNAALFRSILPKATVDESLTSGSNFGTLEWNCVDGRSLNEEELKQTIFPRYVPQEPKGVGTKSLAPHSRASTGATKSTQQGIDPAPDKKSMSRQKIICVKGANGKTEILEELEPGKFVKCSDPNIAQKIHAAIAEQKYLKVQSKELPLEEPLKIQIPDLTKANKVYGEQSGIKPKAADTSPGNNRITNSVPNNSSVGKPAGTQSQGLLSPNTIQGTFSCSGGLVCPVCNSKFVSKSSLLHHMQTKHQGIDGFTCNYCTKTFNGLSHLVSHKLNSHRQQVGYMCQACGYEFSNESLFIGHINTFPTPVTYKCKCGRQFASSTGLLAHQEKAKHLEGQENPNQKNTVQIKEEPSPSSKLVTKKANSTEMIATQEEHSKPGTKKVSGTPPTSPAEPTKAITKKISGTGMPPANSVEPTKPVTKKVNSTDNAIPLELSKPVAKRVNGIEITEPTKPVIRKVDSTAMVVVSPAEPSNSKPATKKINGRTATQTSDPLREVGLVDTGTIKCPKCPGLLFGHADYLDFHIEMRHSKDGILPCNSCPAKFSKLSDLIFHQVISHSTDFGWICKHCGITFTKNEESVYCSHLNSHSVVTHDCRCGDQFATLEALENHGQSKHPNSTDFNCFPNNGVAEEKQAVFTAVVKRPQTQRISIPKLTQAMPSNAAIVKIDKDNNNTVQTPEFNLAAVAKHCYSKKRSISPKKQQSPKMGTRMSTADIQSAKPKPIVNLKTRMARFRTSSAASGKAQKRSTTSTNTKANEESLDSSPRKKTKVQVVNQIVPSPTRKSLRVRKPSRKM